MFHFTAAKYKIVVSQIERHVSDMFNIFIDDIVKLTQGYFYVY